MLSGVNPKEEMNWKQHLQALMMINLVWLVYGFFVLLFQDRLPWNPDGNPGMSPDLSFNTTISLVVNCNLQHYSGETGVSYLSQHYVLMFLNLPLVFADIQKTAWVLVNFLSNVLRYSAEKSEVVLEVLELNQEVKFSVRDFGKGIEERYQKRLFDRYYQVPTDGKNKSGSGLGLAICKDFIEAGNGRIWLQSEIGAGSTFFFTLPKA